MRRGGSWTACGERSSTSSPSASTNRAKHWVDDVNNRRHDPIGLEDLWAMKWWPNRQFTFLLSVAEVNAVQNRARAKKKTGDADDDEQAER
jgi:hypothetical protein